MKKKIIIIGGLGNGSVIANAIADAVSRGQCEWEFAGYLNDREQKGSTLQGFKVLGEVNDAGKFLEQGYYFINTIYKIGGQEERISLFDNLFIPEERLATFIHPLSYVAQNTSFSPGTVIMPYVSVSPGVTTGKCCLVMVNATLGHDTTLGDHCHIAAQACLGSRVVLEKGVHIGLNATVKESLKIGRYAALGMGSVLTKDIEENEIWVGNPAKLLRKL